MTVVVEEVLPCGDCREFGDVLVVIVSQRSPCDCNGGGGRGVGDGGGSEGNCTLSVVVVEVLP